MSTEKRVAVIIVAAGAGVRASSDGDATPKQYRLIGGKPVLQRTIEAFLTPEVQTIAVVIHPEHEAHYAALGLADDRLLPPVIGGAERQASVLAGLRALAAEAPDLVLIQDAARPFADTAVIGPVLGALESHAAALPVVPVTDTIKRSLDGRTVAATEDRSQLHAAQTPQGFWFVDILDAHSKAARESRTFTDDAAIAEWAGMTVALTPGSERNFKLTHPQDFARAERLLGEQAMETRVGTGFDVHAFEPGDAVWLGGIAIPHTAKLKGHSDADAPLHALCDAIYGALGAGDIGVHFPPSDPQWKGTRSSVFLLHAVKMIAERHGRIVNLDVTIVCEHPKIGPHVPAMRAEIASICGIAESRVAIKATTSEQLGFTGRDEGLIAMATVSIEVPRED